jgi:hypothetical protein
VAVSITLGSGTEDNALARGLGQRVEARVRSDGRAERSFRSLRASVGVVATDRRQSATLRFDLGVLTIHDGLVGLPDITLCGELRQLRALGRLGARRLAMAASDRATVEPDAQGPWRQVGSGLGSGELRIYGLWSHPRLAFRLWRLLGRGA